MLRTASCLCKLRAYALDLFESRVLQQAQISLSGPQTSALEANALQSNDLRTRWPANLFRCIFTSSSAAASDPGVPLALVTNLSIPDTKECTGCHVIKAASEFLRHGTSRDKLQHYCIDCVNAARNRKPIPVTVEDSFCSRCGEQKPASDFNRRRRNRSGLQAYCRACSLEAVTQRQRQIREVNRMLGRASVSDQCCSKCGEVKPAAAFDHDSGRPSGLVAFCKSCRVDERRLLRDRTPETFWCAPDKICRFCKVSKLQDEFYKVRSSSNGLSTYCKVCSRAAAERWRVKKLQAATA